LIRFADDQASAFAFAIAIAIGGALVTLPAEIHRVHTRTRRRSPLPSTILTGWRFGNQRRRVLLLAWLTLFPVEGPLPHA